MLQFIVILITSLSTHAVTLAIEPFGTVLESTPVIVRGIVGNKSNTTGTIPETCHDLSVIEVIKGSNVGRTITVCQLGGPMADGRILGGEGAEFDQGEEVVVLLNDRKGLSYGVYGSTRGKLKVHPNGDVSGEGPTVDDLYTKHHTQWNLSDIRKHAHKP